MKRVSIRRNLERDRFVVDVDVVVEEEEEVVVVVVGDEVVVDVVVGVVT